ncbi:hypothetical protein GLOTRDRAFT_134768 [Gloeophyllum trabeum ATCC 11539]|uniref:Uncharacterized protein n=1 Tax=Gloeophyllum trabeum (strain ATCC 11539 / FP-39264 / Madison 617) TaxID=670483 RepID=S7S2L0_GLOTA|nr:uncharacterized protein GLOTRDRAFT_134768 [Gloeophyllum trabeum ATCC 11539]EPQ59989.1 hypothetical protein GLOTRDRAFT_134768 [Gloeophyllum trabeum ATCC 11539]
MTLFDAPERAWRLTVVRTHNVRQLKQEKSWRPIVQLAVDDVPYPEVMLGVDGQNPNLKIPHLIHDASHDSRVDFEICCQSKTKKKSKRRSVLAKASTSLGDILARQDTSRVAEIRLTALTLTARRSNSNGSGKSVQPHAHLHVRLEPPSHLLLSRRSTFSEELSSPISEGALSDTLSVTSDPKPFDDPITQPEPTASTTTLRRRRKKPRGYHLFSDSEYSEDSPLSSGSDLELDLEPSSTSHPTSFLDGDQPSFLADLDPPIDSDSERQTWPWFAPSFLPQYAQYSDHVSVLSKRSSDFGTGFLDAISPYHRLNDAGGFDAIERVMRDLQAEWNYVGASLIALAAIDATVFGLSPDAIFRVDGLAQHAVAAGGLAAGLGLAIDAWLILQYNCTDPQKFQTRALGIWDNYIAFCLTCRLPALCLVLSAVALLLFLCAVAFDVWPTASVVVCFLAGVLVSSQYLLWVAWRLGRGAVWLVRGVVGRCRGGRPPAAKGEEGGGT